MARVFRVSDLQQPRQLAAKVINPRLFDDEPELRERFLGQFYKEARIMEELEHPNIVRLYDYNIEDELPFLIMDYVEGDTLDDRLRGNGRLRFLEAMEILEPVMSALAYAHSRGVVHRDVKPSNILLDKKGGVFLTDFGIARAAQESGLSTRTALTLGSIQYGTPMYMAPEQALRLPEAIGPHTDQYSLAVLAWRMLAGRYYLARTDITEGLDYTSLVIGGKPLPLSRYAPNLPPRAEQAIVRALSKNPFDRFATVNDFLDELKKAIIHPDWTPVADPLAGWQEPDWLKQPQQIGEVPPKTKEPFASVKLDLDLPSGEPEWLGPIKLQETQSTEPLKLTLPDWFDEEPPEPRLGRRGDFLEEWFAEKEAREQTQVHNLPPTSNFAISQPLNINPSIDELLTSGSTGGGQPVAEHPASSQPLAPNPNSSQPLTARAKESQPLSSKAGSSQPLAPKASESQPVGKKAGSSQPLSHKPQPLTARTLLENAFEPGDEKFDFWELRPVNYPGSEAAPGRYRLDWETAAVKERWAYEAIKKNLRGRPPMLILALWPILCAMIIVLFWLATSFPIYIELPLAIVVSSLLTLPFLLGWWSSNGSLKGRQPIIVTGRLVKVAGPYKEEDGKFILKEGRTPGGHPDPCVLGIAPSLTQAELPDFVYTCNIWSPDRLEVPVTALRKRVALVTMSSKRGPALRVLGIKVLSDL
jgi:serine/threonine protein kinase